MESVLYFTKSVAAGGSGFSATHLTELLRVPQTKEQGLLAHLMEVVNNLANSGAPESIS